MVGKERRSERVLGEQIWFMTVEFFCVPVCAEIVFVIIVSLVALEAERYRQ